MVSNGKGPDNSGPRGSKVIHLSLPDLAHRRPDHFLPLLAAPCLGKFGHVRGRAVDAPTLVRVRVGQDLIAFELRRRFRSPDLCPAQEETLFWRKAVDLALRMLLESIHQRRKG